MSYSTGILNKRITVLQRTYNSQGEYGRGSEGEELQPVVELWAAIDFSRGLKAMREGAMDAYDTVMVRLRWHPAVKRESLLLINGRVYDIQSFNSDRQRNAIQITATERPGIDTLY